MAPISLPVPWRRRAKRSRHRASRQRSSMFCPAVPAPLPLHHRRPGRIAGAWRGSRCSGGHPGRRRQVRQGCARGAARHGPARARLAPDRRPVRRAGPPQWQDLPVRRLFSAFQLFCDTGDRLFSTSLLAAAGAMPRLSFDPQGVYELAFNVMPIGDDTVFNELKMLSPFAVIELTDKGIVRHRIDKPLPAAPSHAPLAEQIERHRAPLAAIVGAHVAQFGNHVRSPLSGGLDSRLVLAALREAGCHPELYVYGLPGDDDVEIAQAMGEACGFEVAWTDKYAETPPPDAFPELVARNFHQFDGLPTFGNIFDNGGHGEAQRRRHAGARSRSRAGAARSTATSSTCPTAASPRTTSPAPSSRASRRAMRPLVRCRRVPGRDCRAHPRGDRAARRHRPPRSYADRADLSAHPLPRLVRARDQP
ncbi:hypothetical protein DdX_20970 [Ditylenchus destructor]|uniref:Asparagine synthetase domain-containing protein n=1 Tax=Ditylenchus destructor TaxID=166010 RepID=A0AAD4MH62_9BILA|nr:hypothetical protein DdX_20970 [Ditylenchus destructor]